VGQSKSAAWVKSASALTLRGPFVSASGSGGAGLVGGGEGYAGKDSDGNTVIGGNGFVGAGEGASGTVGVTYTWVRKF